MSEAVHGLKRLKVSEFNVFTPSFFEGTVLGFNTFTGSFRSWSAEEFAAVQACLRAVEEGGICADAGLLKQMAELGMIVAEGVDERVLVRERYHQNKGAGSHLDLTIAPTVFCNFACGYCFQEHPQRKMDLDNMARVKEHVRTHLADGGRLNVTWFGGEPLAAFDVIEDFVAAFTSICEEKGAAFQQSMITNASLLDERKIAFLARQKNFAFIQITVDGPQAVHDQRRPYAGGQGSFRKIMKNIENAADRLPISLRINVDRSNADSLDELIAALVEAGLRDRVYPYLGHVQPYTAVCSAVEDVALSREAFAELEVRFELALLQNGFRPRGSLPKPRFGHLCIADNPKGAVMAPENLLFRCWNEVAETPLQASGFLDRDVRKYIPIQVKDNKKKWDGYDPFTHAACRSCTVQPMCHGGCPWEAAKHGPEGTGHCTTLRFNLPDRLRFFHMTRVIAEHPPVAQGESIAVERSVEQAAALAGMPECA